MGVTQRKDSSEGNVVFTKDLTKKFGEQTAVDSLNLYVPKGAIFGFIGPSGCGKTTTVRLLTGIHAPTSGEATVLGKNPVHFSDSDKEKIGYLIQQFVLYPELTVWENLNFAASFYGVNPFRRGRLNKLLDFVELAEHRNKLARDLSGGMKRRLSLAAPWCTTRNYFFWMSLLLELTRSCAESFGIISRNCRHKVIHYLSLRNM